ncbi:MAG: hypothetical protein AAFX79_08410 [Planctomycetota bacterium]
MTLAIAIPPRGGDGIVRLISAGHGPSFFRGANYIHDIGSGGPSLADLPKVAFEGADVIS